MKLKNKIIVEIDTDCGNCKFNKTGYCLLFDCVIGSENRTSIRIPECKSTFKEPMPVSIKKLETFENLILTLVKKYLKIDFNSTFTEEQILKFNASNNFSKLKIFKLVYVACLYGQRNLFNQLNYWYAMDFGPVEMEIYNYLNGETNYIGCLSFSNTNLIINFKKLKEERNDLFEEVTNQVEWCLGFGHWDLVELTTGLPHFKDAIRLKVAMQLRWWPIHLSDFMLKNESEFLILKKEKYAKC